MKTFSGKQLNVFVVVVAVLVGIALAPVIGWVVLYGLFNGVYSLVEWDTQRERNEKREGLYRFEEKAAREKEERQHPHLTPQERAAFQAQYARDAENQARREWVRKTPALRAATAEARALASAPMSAENAARTSEALAAMGAEPKPSSPEGGELRREAAATNRQQGLEEAAAREKAIKQREIDRWNTNLGAANSDLERASYLKKLKAACNDAPELACPR